MPLHMVDNAVRLLARLATEPRGLAGEVDLAGFTPFLAAPHEVRSGF
jgi:hypothetical protein